MKRILPLILLAAFFSSSTLVLTAQTEKKNLTLDDVFGNRKLSTRGGASFTSMKDGEHYFQVKKDSINLYEYATGKYTSTLLFAKQLVPEGDTVPIPLGSPEFSADETKMMFTRDYEPIYRYSSKANYYVFDTKTGKTNIISKAGKQRLATFSPDGSKVAFVRDNNIFITDLNSREEKQITFDGKMNEVINGATDWVYEEEFGFTQAFFWSPDGSGIAFYRFDESGVKEYHLTYYGDLYPELYKYKYPKAGEANSLVTIHVYDLASGLTKTVDIGAETDIYIPRIKWTNDPQTLALYRMNRHQSKLELLLADAATGTSHVIYTEVNKYYIDVNDNWTFLKDNKHVLLTSEKDGFNHIYIYDLLGNPVRQVTTGNWEVVDLLGIDEAKGIIYFTSTESSPLNRDLYSINMDGKKKTRLIAKDGTSSASFSANFAYFVNRWSDMNTPPYVAVYKANGQELRMITDNAKAKEAIVEYNFNKAEFFTFTTGDGITLNGWMLKPPDFDPGKKYPVLFTIYGGPGSQTVQNRWGTVSTWNQMLAQNGIIMVSVDNRGTGYRGEEFKKCTYLQLGKYETLDQVEAAKYLGTLPYIDKNRIGMWGWSFGGYLTLSSLTKGADYFSLGVAVAPVTNWKYYDNIYTERFMRTPAENAEGYESNSPVNHAGEYKGKLLLIHGMADDNVHPQNSYDMISALVKEKKEFDLMLYPNSNHGIYTGEGTTMHLYKRMTDFILGNL